MVHKTLSNLKVQKYQPIVLLLLDFFLIFLLQHSKMGERTAQAL